jgi:hypothetical protein
MRIVISPERIGYQDLPLKKEQHHYEHNPLGHALLEACEVVIVRYIRAFSIELYTLVVK